MTRQATIRTRHDRPAVVAAAVRPDNTDEMSTRVECGADRTRHDRPAVVAAAVRPDNTDEMSTRVECGADGRGDDHSADRDDGTGVVVTTIQRDTAGGLRTTVDDYVTNLTVAQRLTDPTTQS